MNAFSSLNIPDLYHSLLLQQFSADFYSDLQYSRNPEEFLPTIVEEEDVVFVSGVNVNVLSNVEQKLSLCDLVNHSESVSGTHIVHEYTQIIICLFLFKVYLIL